MNSYEKYPINILAITSISTLISYLIGAGIFYLIGGYFFSLTYVILVVFMFGLSMRFRCTYCYYFGKCCSTGLGLLAGILFKQRDREEFSNPKNIAKVAPLSFGLLFVPLIFGLIFVFIKFSWILLIAMFLYFLIAVNGGFLIRKNLVCKNCKQGEIGCPAYEGMTGSRTAK